VILITGCIDTTTVISVRKDGSGTITEVVYLDDSVISMFEGMMDQMGDENEEKEGMTIKDLDIEKYKANAKELGTGVKYVSAKKVVSETGSSGTQVVYAFEDIQKVNIQQKPENPIGDQMAEMTGAESSENEESKNPITFEFIKGDTPKLIINIPKEDKPEPSEEASEEPPEEPSPAKEETNEQGLAMMKGLLAGFRIRIMVNLLEGKIKKTNATFVEQKEGKDTVTLLDVALGEIMNNEKYAKEWERLSKVKDMDTAMNMMKNIPGLKIETSDRVEISFK